MKQFYVTLMLLINLNSFVSSQATSELINPKYPDVTVSDSEVINKFNLFHNTAETWKNLQVISFNDSDPQCPIFENYSWAEDNEVVWGRGSLDDYLGRINSNEEFNTTANTFYSEWYDKLYIGFPWSSDTFYLTSHPNYRVTSRYTSAYSLYTLFDNQSEMNNLFEGGLIFLKRSQESNTDKKGALRSWVMRPSKNEFDNPEVMIPVNHYNWGVFSTTTALRAFSDSYFALINIGKFGEAESLLPNIVNAANFLINNQFPTSTPNGIASQVYALCGAYRATGNYIYLNEALLFSKSLMSTFDPVNCTFTIGNNEENKELEDVNYTFYHDSQIYYHSLSLRSLIETYSLLDVNHPLKSDLRNISIKALNHILEKRLYSYSSESAGLFKRYYKDIDGVLMPEVTAHNGFTLQALVLAKEYLDLGENDRMILENVTNKTFKKMELGNALNTYPTKLHATSIFLLERFNIDFNFKVNNTKGGIWSNAGFNEHRWYVGNFNIDGANDILRVRNEYGGGDVLVSNGAGFESPIKWTGAGFNGQQWYVGDFNGDGMDDLLRTMTLWGQAEVLLTNGSGFESPIKWTGAGFNEHQWYVGDFDGDGADDILRIRTQYGGADVLKSNGENGFGAPTQWTGAGFNGHRWYVGDFDGDGADDILRIRTQYGGADVLKSNGENGFGTPTQWTGAGFNGHRWYVGDFDGDGDDDILRIRTQYGGADVLKSNGENSFGAPTQWTSAGFNEHRWYVGDFDADGADDIFRTTYSNGGAEVLLSRGNEFQYIPEENQLKKTNNLSIDNPIDKPKMSSIGQFNVYPNPANLAITITYYVDMPSSVSLRIYDIKGQEIEILIDQYQANGEYSLHTDVSFLKPGIYFCKLIMSNNHPLVKKIHIIK